MTLYIFRHGMTYFSKNNLPYGDNVETAEILPEGIAAIKRLGKYLANYQTDANFTSPFARCIQTSKIVSDITSKVFEKSEDLRDWDPRRETVEEMIDRILTFCQKIQNKNFKSVSICTHGYPINAVIAYFTNGEIKRHDLDNFPDPGVLSIVEDLKVSYKNFNG